MWPPFLFQKIKIPTPYPTLAIKIKVKSGILWQKKPELQETKPGFCNLLVRLVSASKIRYHKD
jgi:hypothetical protein